MSGIYDPTVRKRYHNIPTGGVPLAELWDHFARKGLDPDTVTVHGSAAWHTPETDEERETRERFQAERDARHERWERDTYAQLREKFAGEQP